MAIKLSDGLADLSKELGEVTPNQTLNRIKHYNDAVMAFAGERKWPFLSKKNTSLVTVVGQKNYSLVGITDMRNPGGIKEVLIGADSVGNTAYIPVDYEQRHAAKSSGQKTCYIDMEINELVFLGDITTADEIISIRHYYIPTRIEDTASPEVLTFPIPDQYRKAVATLAAAYVQWARYLDAQGNRLFNMYERLLNKATFQQVERNTMNIRKIEHPLRWRGFSRSYPGGRNR